MLSPPDTSDITLRTARVGVSDGTEMILHVADPAPSRATGGAVIVLQEAFGVNDWLRGVAVRCAELGLVAVAPELYHRSGDGTIGSYDAGHETIAPFTNATTPEGLAADVRAAHDWLVRVSATKVDAQRVAAVGFCMGGRVACLANAQLPLAAVISFYGGRLPGWFDLLKEQHAPLLMFWGEKDDSISREQRRSVADRFNQAGFVHTQVVFSEAGHAFFRETRADVYEPRAAGQAWALSLEFLRQTGVLTVRV